MEEEACSYCLSVGEGGGQLGLQDLLLRALHQLVAAVAAPNVHLARLRDHRRLARLDAVRTDAGAGVVGGHPANLEEQEKTWKGHVIRRWKLIHNSCDGMNQQPAERSSFTGNGQQVGKTALKLT